MKTKNKLLLSSFLFLLCSVFFSLKSTYAEIDPPSLEEEAQPIIERVFNIAFISVGIVLVAVAAYGIIKSSLAAGDPRGLEGAKQTWTYAIYGFAVIVLFFAIFAIAQRLLGIPVLTPKELLDNVFDAITSLVTVSKESGVVD